MQTSIVQPVKFNSNAVSGDTPSYFKCNYVEVRHNFSPSQGKRIFPKPNMKNILTIKPERQNRSQPRIPPGYSEQDLDSLKLSIQPDITRGYKNTIRFQSNHYKSFFEKVESSGYRRLSSEITSLHKMPKITRTLKAESTAKQKIATTRIMKSEANSACKSNELSYLLEMHPSRSKAKPLPKIARLIRIDDEIDMFEKKLKDTSFEKSKTVYELYDVKKKEIAK